jgi:heme exporter protein B
VSLAARQFRALILKDLRLELRTRDTAIAMLLFATVAMIAFQFGFGFRVDDTTPLAGGILWATLALTAVLGVGRSFVPEREQRVLDGLLLSPVSRTLLIGARACSVFVYMAVVELITVPLVAVFFVDDPVPADFLLIAGVCVAANLGIAILGSLLAAMAVFSRARELLLPVLFLPALVPVIIAAAGATYSVLGVSNDMAEYRGYVLFLLVYAVIFALVAYATYDYVFDD